MLNKIRIFFDFQKKKKDFTAENYEPAIIDVSMIDMKNNLLNFKNKDDYFNTIHTISTMNVEQLDIWEKNMGFKSLRTRINNAINDIDNAQTKEEFKILLDKYKEIIEINTENSVRPIITDLIYTSIANEDGIYKTDETINKVTRKHIVSASIQKYNTLANIKFTDNNFDNNLKSQIYIENSTEKTNCGTTKNAYKQYNKRRVFVTASRIYYNYNNYYSYYFKVYLFGEAKNLFGNWKSYKTTLAFKDTRAKFYHPVEYYNGSWHYLTYTFNDFSGHTTSDVKSYTKYKWIGQTIKGNHTIPHFGYFNAIECKGSSRGVGNRWAYIKCGY